MSAASLASSASGKLLRDRGTDRGAVIPAPIDRVLITDHAERGLIRIASLVERRAIALRHLLDHFVRRDTKPAELLCVESAHARMLTNRGIHHRLRGRRLSASLWPSRR